MEGQLSLDPYRIVDGFSIIQITDTQFLSDLYPNLYDGLTSWIADKADPLNLTMVVHTGDIVQNPNSTQEWKNANDATMTLYNRGIPYCWNAGNHDQYGVNSTTYGNPNASWMGENYPAFNATIMRSQPYWVGDIYGGKNTAVQFAFSNYHFMVINVEYNANQTVLDWMQTLIHCNPSVNVIVATHDFLDGNGTYGTLRVSDKAWAYKFETILNNYPNVFMTLNGHAALQGMHTAYNRKVGNREEIFFNRQALANQQGAACARIYTFDMRNLPFTQVKVYTYQTYQPYGNPDYITDPADQFTFSTDLRTYWPMTVNAGAGTAFLGANGCRIRFASTVTMSSFTQNGNTLKFRDFTLNGVTSNLTFTTVGADATISKYDPNSGISYTVSGSGSQTFSLNTTPSSVYIDGRQASDGWSYVNGEVTVTGATSSVKVNAQT